MSIPNYEYFMLPVLKAATKGVFVTTLNFTADAAKYDKKTPQPNG